MTKSLIATIGLAVGLTTSVSASINWSFTTDPDPGGALPSPVVISPDGGGTATASLHKGDSATWVPGGLDTTTPLYEPTGYWDPGKNGSVELAALSGSAISSLTLLLFVDDDLYPGVTISGASPSTSIISSGGLLPGRWEQWVYDFSSSPVASITINGPAGEAVAAVLDQITAETVLTAVPEPTTLIAGALLLLPLGLSTWRSLRIRK